MAMQKRNSNRPARENRDRDMNQGRVKRQPALDPNDIVDINDVETLRRFVTEFGKIIPARITGVTNAQQRQIKRGVRRARNMGLLA